MGTAHDSPPCNAMCCAQHVLRQCGFHIATGAGFCGRCQAIGDASSANCRAGESFRLPALRTREEIVFVAAVERTRRSQCAHYSSGRTQWRTSIDRFQRQANHAWRIFAPLWDHVGTGGIVFFTARQTIGRAIDRLDDRGFLRGVLRCVTGERSGSAFARAGKNQSLN